MARNVSVTLGDHFNAFAEQQVKEGRYGSTSEVVRAGLRLLENYEAKLHELRQALQEGIDSGPATPLDMEEIIRSAKREADLQERRVASR